MENEYEYVYIEMITFNEIKKIIKGEFDKKIENKKNNICPYTGFKNNKEKSIKHKTCNLRNVMTGPFNF